MARLQRKIMISKMKISLDGLNRRCDTAEQPLIFHQKESSPEDNGIASWKCWNEGERWNEDTFEQKMRQFFARKICA